MSTPLVVLLGQARASLHMNQDELAVLVGSSTRSVQRWEVSRATPSASHVHRLADAVRAHDPELASQLDAFAPRPAPDPGPQVFIPVAAPVVVAAVPVVAAAPPAPAASLASHGAPPSVPALVVAPHAPAPTLLLTPTHPSHRLVEVLVDSIVCAAAEAMSLAPQAVRPSLVAAFRRARDAGLTPADVLAVLAPAERSIE